MSVFPYLYSRYLNFLGENHELRADLNSEYKDRRKDAIKRVIANMTVGKDVSGLFPDVLKNMQTDDLEQKKLVYLYLMNYAKSQPELVILAVNTFVKVCIAFWRSTLSDCATGLKRPQPACPSLGDTYHGMFTSRKNHRLLIRPSSQGVKGPRPLRPQNSRPLRRQAVRA